MRNPSRATIKQLRRFWADVRLRPSVTTIDPMTFAAPEQRRIVYVVQREKARNP